MSFHGQLPRRQQPTRNITNEIIKAVDFAVSDGTRPAGIVRACPEVERLPKKLRKRQGHSNLKSNTTQPASLQPPRKPVSLRLGAKRSSGKRATSQSSGVSSVAVIPLSYLLLPQKKLILDSRVLVSSDSVADRRFTAPFDLGAGVPDPLRSNPPFAQTRIRRSPAWRKMPSAVVERSDEDTQEPSGTVEKTANVLPAPYTLLVETNDRLQEEIQQLNSALHELTSERVLLTDEIAILRKDSKVTEDALLALWTLFKPHSPGLDHVTSVADVRNAVTRLCREEAQKKPSGTRGTTSDAGNQQQLITSLEEELIQQARFLEHYRKSDTVARRNVHKLSMENRKMQTQLSEAEANRQLLQARLEGVERRFRRLEEHILQNTWV